MYNQKFNPYAQFPSKSNQLYEEEYEEEESQPLVQEIDDNYQPTQKQVRQYAIETLGMSLPEDQGLLYLARQGLIAPIPNNWVPYQSRNGQVYYKHRITQQKTYQHPTDIEYRKKYEQQKEKMARKNLKSMNMKGNNSIGIPSNSNSFVNASSNIFGSKINNSNIFGINEASSANSAIKLDPRIQQRYEQQLIQLEKRLKNQYITFEEQEQAIHQKKLNNEKNEYERQLQKIYNNKKDDNNVEDKLKQQKQNIKKRIRNQLQEQMQEEIKHQQRGLENQFREFQNVYQDDNNLKKNKYQNEKDEQFGERERSFKDFVDRNNQVKENKKKERQQILKKLKKQLEDDNNSEIQLATRQALQQQLLNIKIVHQNQLKQKQAQLQRQYNETKKVLGFDQTAYLSQMATKKSRIKTISLQKIQSYKKKEVQMLNAKVQKQYEQQVQELKRRLQSMQQQQIKQQHKRQEERLTKLKQKLDKQYKAKHESQIQNIYSQLKLKTKAYESQMNKKISSIQEQFINDIYGKTKNINKDISIKIQLKEKEMLIQNKNTIINSLKRQLELQKVTFELMKVQSQIYSCRDVHDVDDKLMKISKKYELQYRPERYVKYENIYKEFRDKYRKDKQLLVSVMNSLQSSKVYTPGGVGSATILKQYNQDVRLMRQNEQSLRKMEILLRKAQLNDKSALEQLEKYTFQYKDIDIKKQMTKAGHLNSSHQKIQEIQQSGQKGRYSLARPNTSKDIQSVLKNHSNFLSNVRSQLNRKLYQIRNNSYN